MNDSCWIRRGDIDVCVDCGAVRDGTIAFAIRHAECMRSRTVGVPGVHDDHEADPYHAVAPLEMVTVSGGNWPLPIGALRDADWDARREEDAMAPTVRP